MFHSKMLSFEQIKQIKNQNDIIFTNGCFDLFHAGHAFLLNNIKNTCDKNAKLIVGINSDVSVKLNKGNSRPIINDKYRAYLVACHEAVDYVFIFDDQDVSQILSILQPKFWCKGGDYSPDSINKKEKLAAQNSQIEYIPFLKGFSSTNIINDIQKLLQST